MNVFPENEASSADSPTREAAPRAPSRSEVVDAVARLVARRGPAALAWSTIAREAGSPSVSRACK